MRMRTIPKAVEEIKREDPDSEVGYWTLRKLISDGMLPVCMAGTKALINMDVLEDVLSGKEVTQNATDTRTAGTTQQ